jgi:hypothetical protein
MAAGTRRHLVRAQLGGPHGYATSKPPVRPLVVKGAGNARRALQPRLFGHANLARPHGGITVPGLYTPGLAHIIKTGQVPILRISGFIVVRFPLRPVSTLITKRRLVSNQRTRQTVLPPGTPFYFTPAVSSLVKTGQVPNLSKGFTGAPGVSSLLKTGQVPTLKVAFNYTPTLASLIKTGQVPSLTVSGGFSGNPSPTNLLKTGQVPILVRAFNFAPGVASIVKTGQIPSLFVGWKGAPGLASKVLTGQVPTLKRAFSYTPARAQITKSGQIPTLSVGGPITYSLDLEFYQLIPPRRWTEIIAPRRWIAVLPLGNTMSIGPKDPSEVIIATLDFTQELGLETISSATVTVSLLNGADPTPSAILNGAANISGLTVRQSIRNGVSGCVYEIRAAITTSGNRTLVGTTTLPMVTE